MRVFATDLLRICNSQISVLASQNGEPMPSAVRPYDTFLSRFWYQRMGRMAHARRENAASSTLSVFPAAPQCSCCLSLHARPTNRFALHKSDSVLFVMSVLTRTARACSWKPTRPIRSSDSATVSRNVALCHATLHCHSSPISVVSIFLSEPCSRRILLWIQILVEGFVDSR